MRSVPGIAAPSTKTEKRQVSSINLTAKGRNPSTPQMERTLHESVSDEQNKYVAYKPYAKSQRVSKRPSAMLPLLLSVLDVNRLVRMRTLCTNLEEGDLSGLARGFARSIPVRIR